MNLITTRYFKFFLETEFLEQIGQGIDKVINVNTYMNSILAESSDEEEDEETTQENRHGSCLDAVRPISRSA
jgi:hypothetical protein